jgi:hypothetical protein
MGRTIPTRPPGAPLPMPATAAAMPGNSEQDYRAVEDLVWELIRVGDAGLPLVLKLKLMVSKINQLEVSDPAITDWVRKNLLHVVTLGRGNIDPGVHLSAARTMIETAASERREEAEYQAKHQRMMVEKAAEAHRINREDLDHWIAEARAQIKRTSSSLFSPGNKGRLIVQIIATIRQKYGPHLKLSPSRIREHIYTNPTLRKIFDW